MDKMYAGPDMPQSTDRYWLDDKGNLTPMPALSVSVAKKEKGLKFDNGKAPLVRGALQYFPKALMLVARVSEFGATKYAWDDWRHVPEAETRYLDALGRHLALDGAEDFDEDSSFDHIAHVAWNALAVLELRIKKIEEEQHGA